MLFLGTSSNLHTTLNHLSALILFGMQCQNLSDFQVCRHTLQDIISRHLKVFFTLRLEVKAQTMVPAMKISCSIATCSATKLHFAQSLRGKRVSS